MRLLLPPSETKRDGGDPGRPLDLAALAFPGLAPQRRAAIAALEQLSGSTDAALAALRISPRQSAEVARNRVVRTAATMPAVDRFTGVLFEALDAPALPEPARAWLGDSVLVHSALFGLVGALDRLPAYRLSHDSRLPGIPLKRHWSAAITDALASTEGLVVDLRSHAYAALGPLPDDDRFVTVRVVTETADGLRRPLNHFNKKGKGELVRALGVAGIEATDAGALVRAARALGIRLERSARRELALVV
ncbi:peroxide stress protein YaaA [Galbitalea sp. SE-J8]|uniref:YaaA family protein n=1 Tax=Galbitalea sp. SE-J8 TaxID=3054952 RepID=UPI00259C6D76|nr:peroxide stress protein YaaA [Galbitalea sp. SE-J8]MDM4763459.1 peroxide stress protein YaaA [Galbitalea sp. SE-J8]